MNLDASYYKLFSALALAGSFSFFVLGVGVAFRWIKFPDLTGDGSFALGGAITARLIAEGASIGFAILFAVIGGCIAGLGTAAMHRYLRVPKILAGVLMMMALYTVNLRVLGRPNLPIPRSSGIFSIVGDAIGSSLALQIFLIIVSILIVGYLLLYVFLESRTGLFLRISGASNSVAISYGVSPLQTLLGLSIANGLIALSGSLVAQHSYSADIHMGFGQLIVAVAALFIGMTLFRRPTVSNLLLASISGSVIYMLLIQLSLEFGIQTQDFRLISTLIVLGAISVATLTGKGESLRRGVDAFGL